MAVAAATALAVLLAATSAAAAPLTSNIDSPKSPSYLLYDPSGPQLGITGTSNATPGGEVDIRCYYDAGTESKPVAANVLVEDDGSFSAGVPIAPLRATLCRLAAIPTGSEPPPSALSQLTGPVLATSEDFPNEISDGPNAGDLYSHFFWGQQLEGSFDYYGPGECGVGDGHLFDPARLEKTTTTLYCNDSLTGAGSNGQTRSAIQVDGANAYTATTAPNREASGFPTFSYTYDQDPATGDVTIVNSSEIVRCPQADYPPTEASCPSYVDTGVHLEQTTVQSHDGLMTTVSDRFLSTDGETHTLDTRPENAQQLGYPNAVNIDYSFPGAETVLSPDPGESVSFDDSAPGAIYLSVDGAPDGDKETGRAAIVFGEPASPATFTARRLFESTFRFQQTATIPAGGEATKRFVFVQAYTQAEVEALAHGAEAAFRAKPEPEPAPTPGGGGGGAGTPPAAARPVPPSNKIGLLGTKLNKKSGTATLKVRVPGAGSLSLSGKKVESVTRAVGRPSVLALKIAAKPRFAGSLAATGKLQVAVKIAFAPSGGSPAALKRTVKLIQN